MLSLNGVPLLDLLMLSLPKSRHLNQLEVVSELMEPKMPFTDLHLLENTKRNPASGLEMV